jgi:autotransporter-associated beta strand protein
VWTNNNSAVFTGAGGTITGETVDVSATVTVVNVSFQTNGYVVADADGDGTFTLTGGGNVIAVSNASDTAVVGAAIGGCGFKKMGNGVLQLTGANTFTGTLTVAQGTLRLNKFAFAALGATGTGNDTVVSNGATLDLCGAYTDGYSRAENLYLSGSGVNGQGALVNTGRGLMNSGLSGITTLLGDTTINCPNRIDFRNTVNGNTYTLTKNGASELAVGVAVNNCKVIINNGNYTYMNALALGGADYDTTMNGGNLRSYGSYKVTERLFCNGGTFTTAGSAADSLFNIAGRVMLNSNVTATVEGSLALELSGYFEGAGGISRSGGSGYVYVTGDTNTYSGPTIIPSGTSLWVGKTNLYAGVLGYGAVTNAGTLYAYSPRLCYGPIVNQGTLYCGTGVVSMGSVANSGKLVLNGVGMLGTGSVVNTSGIYCYSTSLGAGDVTNAGSLYFDATNAVCAVTNAVWGGGATYLRYGSLLTLGNYFSNGVMRVGMGTLTLTNGATVTVANGMTVADRQSLGYSVDPTNVTAVINILPGASLTTAFLEVGDGSTVTGGGMTGVINQVGGTVRTFGWSGYPAGHPGEYDGLHFGHYPLAYTTYNMMGGTLTIDNGYRLAIAIDGTGWFHQTGGNVYAQSVVVNARDASPGGYGRLTVEGGVLNVGSNGITAGVGAAYLVEYGGAGGIVRASTNFASSLNATLSGTNTAAITFDTTNWTISLSGKLSGAGGLNKTGAGTLVLSGTNTYSGGTRILAGTVQLAATCVGPTGTVAFAISTNGTCGVLHATGNLSLTGLSVGVVNPELLDKNTSYPVITYEGAVSGAPDTSLLPAPWYLHYDWPNKSVDLRASVGTLIRLR